MPQLKSTDFSVLIQPSYGPTLTSIHDYTALTIGVFVCNLLSLLFTTLSRFAIAFLPRSKHLSTPGLQLPCMCAQMLQSCLILCDLVDYSPPASSVQGIHQARYWSGLPCPPVGNLPHPGVEPVSPAFLVLQAGGFFTH